MSETRAQQITSKLDADGTLTVALEDIALPAPTGRQVLVKVEAAPINPSDLGLLFGPADIEGARFEPGRIVARMPDGATKAMAARHGEAMPVGNEGAGTVITAGDDPAAQALLGKRVACLGGRMYASHVLVDCAACLPLADGVSAEAGAAAFVNPLTALGFVETMKAEGFTGIVHTAAASNLGQMLVKICAEDGVPLVCVVRSPEQAAPLRGIGASHVVDSSAATFFDDLVTAIAGTGAMLAFDAIGGGRSADTLLTAMERVAARGAAYSRYGSSTPKKVYIYGTLDTSPTTLMRGFGFTWDVAGWLLTPFMAKAGGEVVGRMRARVMAGLTTTFASRYGRRVTLDEMLTREAALAYNARRTGEKVLVVPVA